MTATLAPRLFEVHQHELTSDDYYTPPWVFDAMDIEFDLDVAAPPGGIPWIPARRYFDMADDGLAQPWTGRVWMNPPYSRSAPWVHRFMEHGSGIALLPFFRASWYGDLWAAADGIVLAVWHDGTLFRFHRPEDGKAHPVPMQVLFVAFGEECVEAISRLGRVRR